MHRLHWGTWFICPGLVSFFVFALNAMAHSIPEEQIDATQVYCGSAKAFEHPAEVDLEQVVRKTQEYNEITRKKLARGSAEYWILLEKANQRARRVVAEFHEGSAYDLVVAKGYLKTVTPPITADDVTKDVLALLADS